MLGLCTILPNEHCLSDRIGDADIWGILYFCLRARIHTRDNLHNRVVAFWCTCVVSISLDTLLPYHNLSGTAAAR